MNSLISYEERRYIFAKLERKKHIVEGRKWFTNFQDSLRLNDFQTIVETIKMINLKLNK